MPQPKLIQAGQSETFDILLKLPENAPLEDKSYKMVIGVTADNPDIPGASQAISIGVKPYTDLTASLNTTQILHRKRRSAHINVVNNSPFSETVKVMSADAGILKIETKQTEYEIPARQTVRIPLKFKPTKEVFRDKIVPFSLDVHSESGQNSRLEGVYIVGRGISIPWLFIMMFLVTAFILYDWLWLGIQPIDQLHEIINFAIRIRTIVINISQTAISK